MQKSQGKSSSSWMNLNSFIVLLLITITAVVIFVVFHVNEVLHILEDSNPTHNNFERIKLRSRSASLLHEVEEQNRILKKFFDTTSVNPKPSQTLDALDSKPSHSHQHELEAQPIKHSHILTLNEEVASPTSAIPSPITEQNPSTIHPILYLDEGKFISTPLSTMMSWYGEASGGGTCAIDFGNSLANRWREEKKTYCHSPSASTSSQVNINSSIDCYLMKQTRHAGSGDNLCWMKDVNVRLGLLSDDKFTSPIVETYVNTRHAQQPYIPFKKGFINARCVIDPELWQSQYFPGWNVDWTYNAVKTVDVVAADMSYTDVVEHNVLVVQRDTFANFFHDSEDFFNVFLAMAILEWTVKDTQIYLTDLYPNGPFWEMWSKVFGHHRPPMTAWDLKNKYDQHGGKTAKTYFKNLAIGIYGPAAPMTVNSWDTPCRRTALVRAYSDFVIRGLDIHSYTRYYQPLPRHKVKITFMARRASVEWPEKHFCNDTDSYFKCHYWDGFGIRTLGRMVSNEEELINRLKSLESEVFANGAMVEVHAADYNLLSLEDQIKCDLDTDIMIGPHGAGLMHNIFMPDRAVLMELFIDGSGANRHFHNLANWFGRKYYDFNENNPVNVDHVLSRVREAIIEMDLNSY